MRIGSLLGCCLCLVMPASADIYRCDTARGPLFQDHACDRGSVVAVDDRPTSAGKGLRDSELRWLRQREVRARRKTPRPAHKRRHSDKAQQRRCWNKKARLEKVRAHLRRGYKPTQGERLRRQRRQLEDYLSRFCDS